MLVQSGEVRLARGYGYAERETRRPYGPDTIHDIGSITKQFTAAAVVDLVHQGKIELSAPVRTYLPTAAEPGASVTVEQLLTHRSGMPEYCGDETAQATKSAMLARCLAAPLKTGPQNGYSYSNPGYSVLAMIAEAVSGQDIDTYLKARFFRPLGMNRTGYAVPGDREAALGYDKGRRHVPLSGAEVLNGRHWNIAGNGGMQSTAADMLIWRAALLTPGGPLPEEVRRMLIQPRVKRTGSLYDGFGWAFVVDAQGAPVSMSHAGSDGVFYSYFYARPQSGDFFYLNGNNGEDEVLPLVRAIREAMIAREAARDGTP
jgi:CubicO group peptidase (beta-lactamase class C family)